MRHLDSGLGVALVDAPRGPLTALRLEIRYGSADEQPGQEGLAHVLEHLVVRCAMAGGRVDDGPMVTARTGRESTHYSLLVRSPDADRAARMLLRALAPLADSPAALDAERAGIRRERAERLAQPAWVLQEKLFAALWAGTSHAHPTLGDPAVVDRCTVAVARELHRRWYRPDNAVLVVAPGPVPDAARAVPPAVPPRPAGRPDHGRPRRGAVWASLAGPTPVHGVAFAVPAPEVPDWLGLACRAVRAASGLVVHRLDLARDTCLWFMLRGRDRRAAAADLRRALDACAHRLAAPDGDAWLAAEAVIPALRAAGTASALADPARAARPDAGRPTAAAVAALVGSWRAAAGVPR
ncbi:hypothetical protein GCM10010124_28060 [Pilimelia terevasa]|uniref:Peptidase M16 N-terminal domain-containing protein n=1 Tax=Pilimelia terevasa TaxID=53372 RepID=A0A8J3BSD5_9ACTN|nr:insulinase family protein [Pilimelia terevasa]GGK33908.1 hypothetical protein GCM10010124_28060 [Pilimelia terevasa]